MSVGVVERIAASLAFDPEGEDLLHALKVKIGNPGFRLLLNKEIISDLLEDGTLTKEQVPAIVRAFGPF